MPHPNRSSISQTTIAASFGFALIQLDVTIVNVALPTIAKSVGASVADLQWVVDAYALTFAALLLTGGFLGDRFGAKRVFLTGLALFALASLGCGLAQQSPMLIAGRVLQGIGAAMMLPASLALINFRTHEDAGARAKAIGWWTAAGSITIAAGPVVGGLLIGALSWRSIFLVNLPICLIGAWLARRVEETETHAASRGFDLAGQALGIVALAALTAAAIEAKPLGLSAAWLALAAAGVLAAIGFIWRERSAVAPMLPLSMFSARSFSGATVYGAIVNFTYYGAVFVLSLYLQRALGLSPVMAGLAFLPLTATFFVANVISGPWTGAVGSRLPMIVGPLIDAAGFALLAYVAGPDTPYPELAIAFVLIPLGMGLGVPAMTTAVMAGAEKKRAGTASAVLNAARQAAGAMGVALFGALAGDTAGGIVAGLRVSALCAVAMLLGASAVAAWTIPARAKA